MEVTGIYLNTGRKYSNWESIFDVAFKYLRLTGRDSVIGFIIAELQNAESSEDYFKVLNKYCPEIKLI